MNVMVCAMIFRKKVVAGTLCIPVQTGKHAEVPAMTKKPMTAAPERSIKETHGRIATAHVMISRLRTVARELRITVQAGGSAADHVTMKKPMTAAPE